MNKRIYLPVPYPDELLYSVIARYASRIHAKNLRVVMLAVFNKKNGAVVLDLPNSISTMSNRSLWPFYEKDFIYNTTLFPYYTKYLPTERLEACFEKLLSSNNIGLLPSRSLTASRVKLTHKMVKGCRSCRLEDEAKYGEAYWHRVHQLPGVLVCPEHGQPLFEVNIKSETTRTHHLLDAGQLDPRLISTIDIKVNKQIALEIAIRSRDLLWMRKNKWDAEIDIHEAYRRTAIDKGLSRKNGGLSNEEMREQFFHFYGQENLADFGCQLTGHQSWLDLIVRKFPFRRFHPLHHILMQLFLDHLKSSRSNEAPLEVGHWRCPNSFDAHTGGYSIKVQEKINKKGKVYRSAICSCGFQFTFYQTDPIDYLLPVVSYVIKRGSAWSKKVEQLYKEGVSKNKIAKNMGVTFYLISKILRKQAPQSDKKTRQILKLRKEWMKIVALPAELRFASRKNHRLYKKLWRRDKEWLLNIKKDYSRMRKTRRTKIDWIKRDRDFSEKIREAAQTLKSRVPIVYISKRVLLEAAAVTSYYKHNPLKLPRCGQLLNELSESKEKYRERRLILAAQCLQEAGVRLTPSALKRRACLGHTDDLSERLESLVRNLTAIDASNICTKADAA